MAAVQAAREEGVHARREALEEGGESVHLGTICKILWTISVEAYTRLRLYEHMAFPG
jgi:hypothetical protein